MCGVFLFDSIREQATLLNTRDSIFQARADVVELSKLIDVSETSPLTLYAEGLDDGHYNSQYQHAAGYHD